VDGVPLKCHARSPASASGLDINPDQLGRQLELAGIQL